MVHSPIVVNGDAMKPSTVSKTTSLFLANPVEKMLLSGYSKDPKTNKNTYFYMEHKSNQTRTLQQKQKVIQELKSDDQAELPPHATVSARTPAVPPAQIRRASFSQVPSHIPIRRTKSEGHARGDVTSARLAQSAVPEICADATVNDCFWRKLEAGNHHGSISSSSSICSSDTAIEISLTWPERVSTDNLQPAIPVTLPGPAAVTQRLSATMQEQVKPQSLAKWVPQRSA